MNMMMKMKGSDLEKTMKRGFLVILALALAVGVFISCSNDAGEGLVYIEFSNGSSRDLVSDINMDDDLCSSYPIENLYWFYTATKTDSSGVKTGSTLKSGSTGDALSDHNPVLINGDGGFDGTIGPFSLGTWTFRLYAYDKKEGDDKKLIYTGVAESVTLARTPSTTAVQQIPVELSNAITTGMVIIDDIIYYDGDNGLLTVKSTLTRNGSSTLSVQSNVSPILVTADNIPPYDNAVVGTYYYEVPLFGTSFTDSATSAYYPVITEFGHVSSIEYSDGTTTAVLDTGLYKILSELYYGATKVATILDSAFIVYPGDLKTISGGVNDTSLLPYVEYNANAVARLEHVIDETTTQKYWFETLQGAVNYAEAGDTVYLFRDLSSVTIKVNNAIEVKGIKAGSINSITTDNSNLFVYTSIADTTDDTKVNLKFYLNPSADTLQPLVEAEDTTVYWVSGTLPDGYEKDANGKVTRNSDGSVPLTLEFIEAGNLTITVEGYGSTDINLRYSKDGGSTRFGITSDQEIPVGANEIIQLYADRTSGSDWDYLSISCDSPCYAYGNVMSLISSTDFANTNSVFDYAFPMLFAGNENIRNHATKKLVLPATTVGEGAYLLMFQGCTSLTEAPELPATTLGPMCYYGMFYLCSNLTTAPALLPATSLSESCYLGMFANCTSLESAPVLPATTMTPGCYASMFFGCSSLTAAPALPATELADSCYGDGELGGGMFAGCTSLTEAPALPATELVQQCYQSMFSGCTGLTTAPELPATTLAKHCYYLMFEGCSALETAPALPVTELADYCYYKMFLDCTKLASAPALPATSLTKYCYNEMFHGCTALKTAPVLSATTLAESCYESMFSGCTKLASAPALPATSLALSCYNGMFSGCTSLETAPALSSTTLAESCYESMFSGCTKLVTAPALPATTLAWSCYKEMFLGCTSLEVAPVLRASTLVFRCYAAMFKNCTKLNALTCLAIDGIDNTDGTGSIYNWMDNVAAGGKFTADVESFNWNAAVVNNWEVVQYVEN